MIDMDNMNFFLVDKVSFTRTTITFPIYIQNFVLTDEHLNSLVKRITKKAKHGGKYGQSMMLSGVETARLWDRGHSGQH